MRKSFIFLISLFSMLQLDAQVILTIQMPPQGLTIKPQLWSLALTNTTEDMQVKIEMVFTDVSNNQQVFTGVTRIFNLPKGTRQIQATDVMPITYNIVNPTYGIDPNPDGYLPIGVFNVCYSVIKIMNDASERLVEECETVEVEPVSPPQLVIPSDNERVENTRPFFTWVPPSPGSLFNTLNYDWTLVEVMSTQSAADAVQQNVPIYQQLNLKLTNFQIPLSVAELDTSKLYAWRVTAKNGGSAISNSEVWTFRVGKTIPKKPSIAMEGSYTKVRKEEDGATIICYDKLRYEYLNKINS